MKHLIPLLPQLKKFVEAVENKDVRICKSNSFEVVAKNVKNMQLLKANLNSLHLWQMS